MFRAGENALNPEETLAEYERLGEVTGRPLEFGPDRTMFMDTYAAQANYHMRRFGTTQRQIAAVSAKNHRHSVANPRAFFRKPFSTDDVLAAKPVVYPLTVPMCAPVTDGAAAAVVCSGEALSRYGIDRSRSVKIKACVLVSGVNRDPAEAERQPTYLAAQRAYNLAGVGPADIDVAEVHDAAAIGEIRETENLGLYGFGEGAKAVLQGRLDAALAGAKATPVLHGLDVKPEFGRAIEALLGSAAEAISVSDTDTAR